MQRFLHAGPQLVNPFFADASTSLFACETLLGYTHDTYLYWGLIQVLQLHLRGVPLQPGSPGHQPRSRRRVDVLLAYHVSQCGAG